MTEKEKNYIERHRHWQDQTINQLSVANNFLLTISTGLLAFSFDKVAFSKLDFCLCFCKIEKSLTFYSFSLLFLLLAIACGIIVLISRLYDFRITRNITLTRQRFYQKNEEKIASSDSNIAFLPFTDFSYPNFWQRIDTLWKVIFIKISFLTKDEINNLKTDNNLLKKFNSLREFSYKLGVISWKLTKMQALYFLIGTILYGLSLITK
jgi:hypothetical protein